MATQKPISSISYNSEAFLREKLDTWIDAHIIPSYQYICHKGEDGDKDHIHFRIEPNKKLDPMDLQEQLREYIPTNTKPLGCRPFRPSKEEDWILYAVHDSQYLKIKYNGGDKGEKLPYDWTDIKVSDFYDIEVAFIRAKAYLKHTSVNMASRLAGGENPLDLIMQGENVFTVNAITRALSVNDYQRVIDDNNQLREQIKAINRAVNNAGFSLEVDDNNDFILVPAGFAPADDIEF